jgi:CTP:molybdopterin cytidylyltransferase MocA
MRDGSDKPRVLVLAAGRGRRMGVAKALMPVAGRPWWRWQSDRLSHLDWPVTWVVSEHVDGKLAGVDEAPPDRVIAADDAPMFESVLAGVRADGGSAGLFVLPVDVPAPRPETWRALLHHDRPAIPALAGRRGHPVFLPTDWVSEHLSPDVIDCLDPADRRLDRLIGSDAVIIAVDDPAVTFNLNTPEHVERWIATQHEELDHGA